MGSGYSKMKKQAMRLQREIAQMQKEKESLEFKGRAGNGLVEITLSGKGEVRAISIKPECVDPGDIEGLEDLIAAAFGDAQEKMREAFPIGDSLENLPFNL